MAQLDVGDYYMVAALLHQRIKPLKPLENPQDVEPWQAYRALSAKLAGLFEDDAATPTPHSLPIAFDPLKFISLVMTGAPE